MDRDAGLEHGLRLLTGEGWALALLLALYGLAAFGYVTASFATFFIGQEAEAPDGKVAGPVNSPFCGRRSRCCERSFAKAPRGADATRLPPRRQIPGRAEGITNALKRQPAPLAHVFRKLRKLGRPPSAEERMSEAARVADGAKAAVAIPADPRAGQAPIMARSY